MKIVVVGSGFGGLAAAIRLRAKGHRVTVLEKLADPGGRARVFRQDGFTFDAGPTLLTAPWLIADLFASAGRRLSDHVTLVAVDPFYRIRFDDGTVFDCGSDRDAITQQIRSISPADADGYVRLEAATELIFKTAYPLIGQSFDDLRDMVRLFPDLVRLRAHRSVGDMVNAFIQDPRLRQALSFHPLLLGGNPFATTSIYALIRTLEQRGGVWFAKGGTGALVHAITELLIDLGGELRLSAEVTRVAIDPSSGRANGVELADGTFVGADAVVANSDVARTYIDLVPGTRRRRNTDSRIKGMRHSMSLFVVYFGTNRKYDGVAHHEIVMGPRYRDLLDDIFERKTLSRDFALYLHRPTATDPSLAPPGCDAFYALSPVPHLGGSVDWDAAAEPYRDAVMEFLEERCLPGLSSHIVTERRVDPRYFRDALNSHLGSAFSFEPTLMQSAWFRPHNRSEDVPNLYFAGAGTHPGAGVPGVLSSGKIVADMIGSA